MNISVFAFRLLLLFFPGIICSYIIDIFTVHKERTQFQFIINSFLFGLISYILFWGIIVILHKYNFISTNTIVFFDSLNDMKHQIAYREIIYVCFISVIIGLIVTAIHTYKLHFKLLQKLKITRKFGELDVWGYLMNSPDIEWVTVRDNTNNLMYDGWVQAFSDNSKEAELLLGDVIVYTNDTGKYLYNIDSQYLALDRNNISIEIRHNNTGNNEEEEND